MLKNAVGEGGSIEIDVDEDNTINEVIEAAADYWNVSGAFKIRFGKKELTGQRRIGNTNLQNGDVVELIPHPPGG